MRTAVRALAVMISLLVLAVPAHAAMLYHHDLASLAFMADAVVAAERTGGPQDAAAYRVVKVFAGQGLRVGDAITIEQRSYLLDMSEARSWLEDLPQDATIEPIAILFLRAATDRSEPAWSLVSSGLRIFVDGRAYRFVQGSNPGPYIPIPQGRDPDEFHFATGVHWDRAELERAIPGAVERADHARAASAARDPAQILALMPTDAPNGGAGWSYEDRIALRGFDTLIAAGDIDAALDLHARIRGRRPFAIGFSDPAWFSIPGHVSDSVLLARIESSSTPLPRRIAALSLLDLMLSGDTLGRLMVIVRDVEAPTALRVAAIEKLTRMAHLGTSDSSWPERRQRLAANLRSLIREVAPRAPDSVRTELVECAEWWNLLGVVPTRYAIVASATQRNYVVAYHVAAAPGVRAGLRGVTLLRSDGTACEAKELSGWLRMGDWGGRLDARQCPEAAQLRIEVRRGGSDRVWTVPIER